MVPRGRVELPTPAFSGPRSTGELPRHRHNKRFYGKAAATEREKRRSQFATEARRHRGQEIGKQKIEIRKGQPQLRHQPSPLALHTYRVESSNSFIQSLVLRTSRGLEPSAGPTMPSFSMRSIKRAARP